MDVIIGESGGTKTDWVIVRNNTVIDSFTGTSLHPLNWSEAFFYENKQFWLNKNTGEVSRMELFAAGCYNPQNAEVLQSEFRKIGFDVRVRSDLHAAGFALYGSTQGGKTGIMGTGSVVFDFSHGEVSNVIGGLGYLKGDQGSAYYFGKLLLEKYDNNELSGLQKESAEKLFSVEKPEVEDRYHVARLSLRSAEFGEQFRFVHEENIHAFISTHHLSPGDHIALAGSYAWYQQDIIRSVLKETGIEVTDIIERPIARLIDRTVALIE